MRGGYAARRASARQWFLTSASPFDVAFAREHLVSAVLEAVLEAARMFLRRPERADEGALEALVQVARMGNERQRREALRELREAGKTCQSIARPLIGLLKEERNSAYRIDMVVILAELAKAGGAPLDSSTRAEVAKAVAGRFLDPAREVRFVARIALQNGGPLHYLIKECELTLMELLRSSDQHAVDAAAGLILENKAELKAALGCLPASKAHASLLKNVL